MLAESVDYLQKQYGSRKGPLPNGEQKKRAAMNGAATNGHWPSHSSHGWEILIVSDGSTDATGATALQFARDHGPETAASIRVVSLQENRGKGGAVTHGMRHVRGRYAIFADADGASQFADLDRLVEACRKVEDAEGRAVAVGSRAHLVGSDAVVKVHVQSPPPPLSSVDEILPRSSSRHR